MLKDWQKQLLESELGIVDNKNNMKQRDYQREIEVLEMFLESEIRQKIGSDCYREGLKTCLRLIQNGL